MRRTLIALFVVLTAVCFVACSEIVPGDPDSGGDPADTGTGMSDTGVGPADSSIPTDAPMSGA